MIQGPQPDSAVLQIDALSLRFIGEDSVFDALEDVSLTVNAGEIVGLVGESGSGKSVTALSILQLLSRDRAHTSPDSRIAVFGRDVLTAAPDILERMRGEEVAMVFQEPMTALNPVLSVGTQISDVIRRHQAVSAAEARKQILALLRDMKIDDPDWVFDAYPHELSGGMRQRGLIAMAFSCHPKLIVADEPTTALDVMVQAQILHLLRERARVTGTAILLISHDLAVVSDMCDRVYVMREGAIVEQGPTAQIISAPRHPYTRALLNALPEGKPPKSRLTATDSTSPPRTTAPPAYNAVASKPLLEIRNAAVHYPRGFDVLGRPRGFTRAVDDVSLTVGRGETVSIVGESGSGKSSVAHAIVGIAPLASGVILYDAQPLNKADSETRRQIQMVFQDPRGSLDPRWPAWRILTEPLTVGAHPSRRERRAAAAELCRMVGLDPTTMDRPPHAFSGGQRQRLAIGRALAVRPRLLVLDEPTSALDVSVQAQILGLLLDLQETYGLSYLFISHDVSVVGHISDRIAVMNQGRIVETGAAGDVIARPVDPYTRDLMAAVPRLAKGQTKS